MEQVEFDSVGAGFYCRGGGCGGHFCRFSRQAQNDVGHHFQSRILQPAHRVKIDLVAVTSADVGNGCFMDRLQTQFHRHGFDAV